MRKKWKARIASGILSAAMIVTMLPVTTFAAAAEPAKDAEATGEMAEDEQNAFLEILKENKA